MRAEMKYYRIFAKRFPPRNAHMKPYLLEEDVKAYSKQGARNVFLKYHSMGYGDHVVKGLREITEEEFCGNHEVVKEGVSIDRAIAAAKEYGCWRPGPASVTVHFDDRNGHADSTVLELQGPDTETELIKMWESIHEEKGADIASVKFVVV